ncbi:hypothetical protein Tco_0863769 [Tanacetum coccineum]
MYPPEMTYYTGCPEGGYRNDEGSPSPLIRWIKEFQLLNGLRAPPHVGYYYGNGNPDDFIHAFEGATKMEKWVMPVSCHVFVYILKDAARVWWNSLPKGVVLNYKDLKRRKGKAKQMDTQLGECVDSTVKAEPTMEGKEEPILMIWVVNNPLKRKEPPKIMSIEEMIFPPIRNRALMTSNNVTFISSFVLLIMKYLVKISTKEDTAYLCLHFIRNHEDLYAVSRRYHTPYPRYSIRRSWKILNMVPTPRNSLYAVLTETDTPNYIQISSISVYLSREKINDGRNDIQIYRRRKMRTRGDEGIHQRIQNIQRALV